MARWHGELVALALGLVAAAFAVGADHGSSTTSSVHPERARAPAASVHPERARAPASASRRDAAHPSFDSPLRGSLRTNDLPPSLTGTEPDGALHVLDDTFIPTPGALRYFDYYLTTVGEGGVTDLGAVRALVAAETRRRTPAQADAVLVLFDRYVAYLDDVQHALELRRDLPLADVHAVTVTRQRARFGDDADVLFAAENALAAQLLAASPSWQPRSRP